jgi:hypothetical protein
MMTLLQLTNRTMQECAVSGGPLTTVANLSGEQLRILTWVQQAWTEVQEKHNDWQWMRSSNLAGGGVSFVPSAGVPVTPLGTGPGTVGVAAGNFGKWVTGTFRTWLTSVGTNNETFLDDISYDEWRDAYMYGSLRTVQTRPVVIAPGPAMQLCVGPPSDGTYTVTGDYYWAPTSMTSDSDTPTGLPSGYDMVIVYQAMLYYGGYESAPEVLDRGTVGYSKLMSEMEAKWLPECSFAGCL